MSEISLFRSDWALVTRRFVMPSLAASSLIDWVSAMRNGFASFSDWEKPTTAPFRSTWGYPVLLRAQPGPALWFCAADAAGPSLDAVVGVSLLVPPVTSKAATAMSRMRDIVGAYTRGCTW